MRRMTLRDLFHDCEKESHVRQLFRRKGTALPLQLNGVGIRVGRQTITANVAAWREGKNLVLLLQPCATVAEGLNEALDSVKDVLDSVTDSFFHLDKGWTITYVSPKAERLFRVLGARVPSIVGANLLRMLPEPPAALSIAQIREVIERKRKMTAESFYPPLNTWFEIHAFPFHNGAVVYLRDITRRKLAEAAFLKLSNAIEQTSDAVFITNRAGYIEYVNPAFEKITQYRRSEALGKTPSFLRADQQDDDVYTSLWSGQKPPEIFQATSVHVRKTGNSYYAEETITPVRESDGRITHFVTTLRDITERIRTDEALRQSEERFRALVENSSDGIALLSADGRIIYAGPSTNRIIGYSSTEFLRKNLFELLHPSDRSYTEPMLTRMFDEPPQTRTLLFRLRHKDGTWKWIEATVNNQTGDEALSGLIMNYRDISDRKRIEEALQRSEIEYRNLFERANDAIFIFEPDTEVILEANTKACDMYGFGKDELIGMSLKRLTKDVARGEEQIQLLLREESSRNFESVHFAKDGHPMEMIVNSTVVEYNGRKAILSILRDLSEMRKLENQLRQAQKMESIGTLAGGIAHDFNNILSIILGYTSLLKRGRIDPEKIPESLNAITKAAQRGAVLVKQILTFARKTEVLFESVNTNEVLQDLTKLLSETFPKTITFKLELDDRLPSIVADSNQLHQVFMNLCVNARDAMGETGTLTIRSELASGKHLPPTFAEARQKEYVLITITDTGVGMDEATRNRIFEPFFTTKRQGQGTGLGLSVVYGIVNTHRGHVEVESELGKGTTFRLFFPVQMRAFESPSISQDAMDEAPGGQETILVIEDEEMLLNLVKNLLESKGYEVLTAMDGAVAMDLYQEHQNRISLVLTDIGLPKLSGWEVCRQINELDPRAKVVVASGYLDPNVKSEMKSSSAKEFIHKPYLPDDVLKRIRKVLDS